MTSMDNGPLPINPYLTGKRSPAEMNRAAILWAEQALDPETYMNLRLFGPDMWRNTYSAFVTAAKEEAGIPLPY